ncbi:MAG TPA: enoyl-CoA hydratase/isomerase family protein [Vicinamibacteria bacterium]|nr:enoyl-CoA hydratase/isomerase family protein [Vicinamibacteria bacterium]
MALVNYSKNDGLAVMELDHPPANTYSYEMMQELDRAILDARMDDTVHVLVLTGAGEKFFCSGADIGMLNEVTPEFKYYFCLHANETLGRLETTRKLVIAALNGHTVGGGLEVALACDLRVAKKGTAKIGLPEVQLGVLPGTGGTQRLARLLGRARALELMVTGKLLGFEDAAGLGLVNELFDADGFRERALQYAAQFVPPNRAARAVGSIKRAVCSGLEAPFSEGLALERELQQQLFLSEDATEGIAANVEKRKASFRGR